MVTALALSVVLAAAPPRDDWTKVAVPVLENTAMSLLLLAFSDLVTREPFAFVSRESVVRNLDPRAWTFDVDYYLTNQFGHPYQGAWYFSTARSSGGTFWGSALSATLFSLVWELLFETEPPSVNDQITTPLGGAMLGEVLHRSALKLRRAAGPRWLTLLGAALLDPAGALNAALLGEPPEEDAPLEPMSVCFQGGVVAGVVVDQADHRPDARLPAQALVAVQLVSGPPWDPRTQYRGPFSSFELRADLAFPVALIGNLFIRGLLHGWPLHGAGRGPVGVWGLYGAYDYAAPAPVRASAVGVGPGFGLQLEPGLGWALQLSGLLAGSPLIAAGQLRDVDPSTGRDYHVGPGLQAVLSARLVRPRTLVLELLVRAWLAFGVYARPTGLESITMATLGAHLPLGPWLALGAEATLSDRRATSEGTGPAHDTGVVGRAVLTFSIR